MAVLLLFKQLLTTSFGLWRVLLPQKNSQWDFTKIRVFIELVFLNIIEPKSPTRPRVEFFCVLLRSLPRVNPEPASRRSACPPRGEYCRTVQIQDQKLGLSRIHTSKYAEKVAAKRESPG